VTSGGREETGVCVESGGHVGAAVAAADREWLEVGCGHWEEVVTQQAPHSLGRRRGGAAAGSTAGGNWPVVAGPDSVAATVDGVAVTVDGSVATVDATASGQWWLQSTGARERKKVWHGEGHGWIEAPRPPPLHDVISRKACPCHTGTRLLPQLEE